MADYGSRNLATSSEKKPKMGATTWHVSGTITTTTIVIKSMDTCCEVLKTVKLLHKAIQNPTEVTVDIKVDSKGEGKWSVAYEALDFKVGSLSEGTDTVSHSRAERSVTRFFNNLTGNRVDKVEYYPLDCDTMHTIGDVVVTEDSNEGSPLADSEGLMDMTTRRNEETLSEGRSDDDDELKEAKPETENDSKSMSSIPLWSFCAKAKDSERLKVSMETSKNLGYRTLKLKIEKPETKKQHQLLFIFKSNDGEYLKKPVPNIVKDLVTSYVKKSHFSPDVALMAEGPKYTMLMFLSSKGQGANGSHGSQGNAQDTIFAVGLDWVPCLEMKQWPKEAEEWRTRDRKSNWPGQELIDEVVKAGCHLVPKAHPDNQDDATDMTEWRISFSEAERILFMHLSDTQKTCFRMFKMVTQLHCKVITDEKEEYPSSYSLKTIFLWACDEIAPTDWEQKPGRCFLELLMMYEEALEKKTIKGYFIAEMNLIGHIDSKLIQAYLVIVREIVQEPIKYLKETWQAIIEPKLGWTFDQTFGDLMRCADKSDEDQDIAKSRSSLNLALMINDYICQGAVMRNFFMTKMAQQVYGCQGSSTAGMKMIGNKVDDALHVAEAGKSGLDTVKHLVSECGRYSCNYSTNPAVLFGILPQLYILSGEIDYMVGRVQEAKESSKKAIDILTKKGCQVAPRSMTRVFTVYAKCLAALLDQNAMQGYENALKFIPNNREVQVYAVMFLDRTGQKERAAKLIKDIIGSHDILKAESARSATMIQISRGDLPVLDEVLCSEVKALLDWKSGEKFPQFPYRTVSEAVPKVFLPDALILSHLHIKGQNITKVTLNNELRPWVNLIADAGKMGRADCQYIANSLLGFINYTAGNYWEALKLFQGQAKTGLCSERVIAHLDLLKTIFKITIE